MTRSLLLGAIAWCCLGLELQAARLSDEEISTFGGCYFAPVTSISFWRMRDQDGAIREFEAVGNGRRLQGLNGWTAELNGIEATVYAPASEDYPPVVYHFSTGRLVCAEIEGRNCRFSYPHPLVYEDEEICSLWPEDAPEIHEEMANNPMWKDDGRLHLWFASPNQAGTFLGLLFLTACALAIRFGSRLIRAMTAIVAVAFAVLLALTGSRSAILAAAIGFFLLVLFQLRALGLLNIRRILLIGLIVLAGAAAVLSVSYLKSARSSKGDRASDAQRIELLSAVPNMMHDAPHGCSRWSEVGRIYSRWYQPSSDRRIRFNLIGDQITTLVAFGWLGSFAYVFAVSCFLFLLCRFAWRGGTPCPLTLWLTLAVTSSLNVVMVAREVFVLPVLSLVALAVDRRWLRRDFWLKPLIGGLACAVMVIGVIFALGNFGQRSFLPMHHGPGYAVVNGSETSIFVVDDCEVLGPPNTTRDIRRFYQKHPFAPAIAYTRDLDNVPETGVERLVLSGRAADEFLRRFKEDGRPSVVPREIVFLSPSFAPSAIPLRLRSQAKVRYVIGEFAARYHADLASPPKWSTIVPGAEIYIPGWMRYCVN